MSILKTGIAWKNEAGEEREAFVRVTYTGHEGFRGSYIDPPEPASVEIQSISLIEGDHDIPDSFYEDDALLAECLQDWHEDGIAAAEYRAEAARDRLMEGF